MPPCCAANDICFFDSRIRMKPRTRSWLDKVACAGTLSGIVCMTAAAAYVPIVEEFRPATPTERMLAGAGIACGAAISIFTPAFVVVWQRRTANRK
jgi:hypothetical protein